MILRAAPRVLKKEDAQWVHNAADPEEWISCYYVIAAARLDPGRGPDWLKQAAMAERDQHRRCELLAALWAIGGQRQTTWVAEQYYLASKPEYNAGGLQEDLIRRVGAAESRAAAPLLATIIRDKRFRLLGWSATRALAQHADKILGQETAEVKRYLRVRHRMGRYEYEMRPELREDFPVDTKHVQMQTKAFQEYLQAEVKRRQGT